MWWLYFDTSAEAGSKTISSSHDPGKLARLVYTYIHLFIVGGIIVAAVADEFVLHHPTGHSDFKTIVSALGSTALYLVGNLLFKWTITGRLPVSHVAGLVAVAVLGVCGVAFPAVSALPRRVGAAHSRRCVGAAVSASAGEVTRKILVREVRRFKPQRHILSRKAWLPQYQPRLRVFCNPVVRRGAFLR